MSITDTAAPGKDNIPSIHSLKQVLIVDDEPELLQGIRSKLEDNECFRIRTACGGREALEFLDLEDGRIDLAAVDLEMPEMDGMELIAAMSESFPEIPNMAMTEFGFPVIEQQLKKAGPLHVLTKPVDVEILKSAVDSARHACGCRQCSVLPLKIFLELTAMERKTVRLKVFRSDEKSGSLFFREGMMVDAEQDGLSGEAAVLNMLEWKSFALGLKEFVPCFPEPGIESDLVHLLLRTPCRMDCHGTRKCLEKAREEFLQLRQREQLHGAVQS